MNARSRQARTSSCGSVIELFAGAGGFTWGWERAGFRPWVAIDNDVAATRTHELNFPHAITLQRDLSAYTGRKLIREVGRRPRDLVALIGGPPCQGWSKAGRGKLRSLQSSALNLLRDPRNKLYRRFLGFVSDLRPPVCVMENVPGMLSIEGQNVAATVAQNFSDLGYRCSYVLANARWFGVPQDRKRLIFFAWRRDSSATLDGADLEVFAHRFRSRTLGLADRDGTVRDAIHDLPSIADGTREDPAIYRTRGGRRTSRFTALMRSRSNGLITDHVTRGHNSQDLGAFAHMPQGGLYRDLPKRFKRYRDDVFFDKYKRLYWDRPSWTVTAHLEKDVYTHIHPGQPRTISIREAARLQSFPDDYRFFGNMGDRFRQIGNAVPPLMAWGIAEYVKEAIGRR